MTKRELLELLEAHSDDMVITVNRQLVEEVHLVTSDHLSLVVAEEEETYDDLFLQEEDECVRQDWENSRGF